MTMYIVPCGSCERLEKQILDLKTARSTMLADMKVAVEAMTIARNHMQGFQESLAWAGFDNFVKDVQVEVNRLDTALTKLAEYQKGA